MSEGRYALAVARLEDALAVAPDEPDVLVDLGSALYRLDRYDDADRRFHSALDVAPDDLGALEGVALVAVTQKRYPQAREQLRHLLRLRPESGKVWLRYGDVEHHLGNENEALQAWERVLTAREADADVRHKAQRRLDYLGPRPKRSQP
jgi:tetratricopeptide (TPR) repeat protein